VRRAAFGAALLAAALLAGCATAPRGPDATLSGRLLIKVAAQGGQPAQSHSAAFELSGDEQQGQMRLLSPLGTQVALARWRAGGGAWLDDAQGTRKFRDLADMADAALGEPVPLNALLHWLQGRPWPGAAHQRLDTGAPGFVQLGWVVDLGQWADAALVEAHRLDPPGVSVRAKLDRGS